MFIVFIVSRSGDFSKLISRWRKNFKNRLPEDIKREVLIEAKISKSTLLALFRSTLMGLFLALKLKKIADDLNMWVVLYKAGSVIDVEKLIDEEIRKRIEEIPPEMIHPIKETLKNVKLPRKNREEIINYMLM